jgi:hypothetical protein
MVAANTVASPIKNQYFLTTFNTAGLLVSLLSAQLPDFFIACRALF